jgi:hypothetical protein
MERFFNNLLAYIWFGLAAVAGIGAIFFGASHHFFTGIISLIMGYAMYIPKEENNESRTK